MRDLEGYVETGARALIRRELPFGGIPMIIVFGPGFALHDEGEPNRSRRLERTFIAGLQQGPTLIGSQGSALCMQVNFTPQGAWRFCGIDMSELSGRVVDLDAVIGAVADRLAERLCEAKDWLGRFALVEDFLWDRMSHGRAENRLVAHGWHMLEQKGGQIPIEDLAKSLGCSRKHLAHLFQREIGLPPKAIARVLRFERAIAGLRTGRLRTLADLAASCGYADQAHFNRDFLAFAGETPTALIEKMLEDGTGIIETKQ